jgi:putative protease
MNKLNKKPELLAPAGNWMMLNTAIHNGADAIYFGVENLNMRAAANNFAVEDLPKIVELCRSAGVKAHLTLNTIIYEGELEQLDEIVQAAKQSGVDLVICWDMSVINKCLDYNMPFCISTQASISNSEALKFYERLGASRVVLARECTLDKIREIKSKTSLEIETFVHGAMCVAISGRCFMSHELFNKSANKGECLQPCRREYEIKDVDDKYTLILGEDYIMSPKDLCTIQFIDKLIESGIDSFKIEGRKRSPEYISTAVSTYRKAIDLYFEGNLTDEIKTSFYEELQKVYNRGFSSGFYFGVPGGDGFTDKHGSSATTKKAYVGKVLNYYKQSKIVFIRLEAETLAVGDSVYLIGNTTGVINQKVSNMIRDNVEIEMANKGDEVTFVCEDTVRVNDKVYKIIDATG